MYKTSFLSVLVLLFAACSSEVEIPEEIAGLENLTVIPADTEPAHTINFNREASYGDTEEVLLGQMAGVAVDSEARVFIADRDQNVIHAFGPEGKYISRIGREGNGPGEFTNIFNLQTDEQFLYAFDFGRQGINVFGLESLEYSHFISLAREDRDIEELQGTYPGGQFYVRNDGSLMLSFNRPFLGDDTEDEEVQTNLYYLLDGEGRIVPGKIFEQRAAETLVDRDGNSVMMMATPYGRNSLLAVDNDDRIYSAWTENFLIKVHNADGEYEKAVYYPYSKSPLDLSEVISEYGDRQRSMIRNDDVPDTWPALNSLVVDDQNRLWLSTITDDREVHDWWVIDEDGELLTRFTWPENRSLLEVKSDYLYTRETDEETDLQQIVRYSIDF